MTTFAITFDYLCPFARNANEHVITALGDEPGWDVDFVPFSLAQTHVGDDEPDVWDAPDPDDESGLLALQAGLAVRDDQPAAFHDTHVALFAARHDEGADIREPTVVRHALEEGGADPDRAFDLIDAGKPLEQLREEHTAAVEDHEVFGVPTFITDDRAVFVRLLDRGGQPAASRRRVEQVLDLTADLPELHEFKQTDLPR